MIILIFFKLFTLKHSCSLFDLVCFQGFNREIQILNNHSVLAEFLSCPFHKSLFLLFITLLKYFFLFPNLINQHLSLFLKSLFLWFLTSFHELKIMNTLCLLAQFALSTQLLTLSEIYHDFIFFFRLLFVWFFLTAIKFIFNIPDSFLSETIFIKIFITFTPIIFTIVFIYSLINFLSSRLKLVFLSHHFIISLSNARVIHHFESLKFPSKLVVSWVSLPKSLFNFLFLLLLSINLGCFWVNLLQILNKFLFISILFSLFNLVIKLWLYLVNTLALNFLSE